MRALLGALHKLDTYVDARQPSEPEQTVFFEAPDLYHSPPDSGELPYKSRAPENGL